MAQTGFDFFGGDTPAPFSVHPEGTWTAPRFTTEQFIDLFAKADAALLKVAGPSRALFRMGIEAARNQNAAMLSHRTRNDEETYSLWRTDFMPAPEQLDAFMAHCLTFAGTHEKDTHSAEWKIRRTRTMTNSAMFVKDIGTVIYRQWADSDCIDYHPWRDTIFLDSYSDDMPAIFAPHAAWSSAYCADKLACADGGIANIPTFTLNGRQYINSGGCSQGNYRECNGWTFRPMDDWHGPTFSYRTMCQAWDEGRTQRGDKRGLIVSVRGQLVALDGVARIYDDKAADVIYSHLNDAEEEIIDEIDEVEC